LRKSPKSWEWRHLRMGLSLTVQNFNDQIDAIYSLRYYLVFSWR
jgi:hypothetical protein